MSADKDRHSDSKVTIKIPRLLYNRLAEIVDGSGFNSVTDFIVYVLRDLVSTHSGDQKESDLNNNRLSPDEIEAIRKRLKSLGYL
ncbi:CopG family transcriptional regulator [Acidobacteriota bacterium]